MLRIGLRLAFAKRVYYIGVERLSRKELRERNRLPATVPQCVCYTGNSKKSCPYSEETLVYGHNQETGLINQTQSISIVEQFPPEL